jgi:galactose mutarotase-like enzyme
MRYTLSSDQLNLSIDSKGAELRSIKHQNGYEYLWQGDTAIWPRCAPVLFPIVGKLRNDSYALAGKTYTLPQHGFARDLEFTVVRQTAQELILELSSSEVTKANFPFDFELRVGYSLLDNTLKSSYSVKNTGHGSMWFSLGAHPGFNVSLVVHEGLKYPYLETERNEFIINGLSSGLVSEEHYPLALSEKRLDISSGLFQNDALVMEGAQIKTLTLHLDPLGKKITLSCPGWPYFGLWSKPNPLDGALKFVCLEPWYGLADSVNHTGELKNKKGILSLEAGQTFEAAFELGFF